MADALLARETLDAEQVRRICAGLPLDDPRRGTASRGAADARGEAAPRSGRARPSCRRCRRGR